MREAVRILVAEDEFSIQCFVEDALAGGGFQAEIAPSGDAAFSLFSGNRGGYRALLTDIRVGAGLNGWTLARKIREIEPDFPVVYMTGADADGWKSQGVPNSILIEKPFAPAQLITAISQLLNTGTAS